MIAALFGALTADQVMAARLDDDYNLLELDDDEDFGNDDFQELEADLDSYAPAKKAAAKKAAGKKNAAAAKKAAPKEESSSEDVSTSDDERHEAYKDGERNSSQA